MSQLELFGCGREDYLAQDLIEIAEISGVLDVLKNFLQCDDYGQKQIPNLIVKGKENSGKTHLMKFLKEKYSVNIIDLKADTNLIGLFEGGGFYIIEDVDRIKDDEILLNIINLAKENKAFLILTLTERIITKIKDLDSRLKNFFLKCEIKSFSEDSKNQLAVGYLSRRQIKPTNKKIKEIVNSKWGNS